MPQQRPFHHSTAELAGTPPGWLIRSGSGILLMLVIMVLFLAYLIRYPEKVVCQVTIVANVPPSELKAKSDGRIQLLSSLDQNVLAGEEIAYIVGDIDPEVIGKLQTLLSVHEINDSLYADDLSQIVNDLPSGELRNATARLEIALRNHQDLLSRERGKTEFTQLHATLTDMIKRWEQNFLIKAPVDGTLVSDQLITNNQWVKSGEALFYVIPQFSEILGLAYLDQDAGKIAKGQTIRIKLDDFNDSTYGLIEGTVTYKAEIKTEKGVMITLSLPNPLATTYQKSIPFSHNMTGTGEIVIRNTRLLERLFSQIKSLTQNDS